MSFSVQETTFGTLPALRLRDPATGASALVALRGATLLAWEPDGGPAGGVVDGYRDEAEFHSQDGVRNGLMAPFSNRVRDGRYGFDGEDHDLLPGVPAADRVIYHGFLRELDCDVVGVETGDDAVTVRFATGAVRPGVFPGYPFAVDLEVALTMTARGLDVALTGTNVGDRAAPYASGWHPYFRLGPGPIDPLVLHIPARTAVATDDLLLPLPGDGAFVASKGMTGPIGDAVLDMSFADLEPDPDGLARTVLTDPDTGTALTVWQPGGLMHVFTGDTLARDRRASVALEPVELMTDAFNRPDLADAVTLAPGATRTFAFGVRVDPAS